MRRNENETYLSFRNPRADEEKKFNRKEREEPQREQVIKTLPNFAVRNILSLFHMVKFSTLFQIGENSSVTLLS
jgi:hypothetical protein